MGAAGGAGAVAGISWRPTVLAGLATGGQGGCFALPYFFCMLYLNTV